MRAYSLRKSKKVLHAVIERLGKKRGTLADRNAKEIDAILRDLKLAIDEKDRQRATRFAEEAELFHEHHLKKTPLEWFREAFIAISVALIFATIIRQSWFELYEIPSGSMRPTYQEGDRLSVTKTQFGIKIPLITDHFWFEPENVKRTGVIVFTADGLPHTDVDTRYFYLFPGKKRFVKRMIGKPGDSLYFYGGKIYGVDQEGKPIEDYQNASWMEALDHVPFLSFHGILKQTEEGVELLHYNIPIGKIDGGVSPVGKIFDGKEWVEDRPTNAPHDHIQTFGDNFGMNNFAMSRIVKEGSKYFLELTHTPNLKNLKVTARGTTLGTETSLLPLDDEHLFALLDHLTTSRFVVNGGRAHLWDYPPMIGNPYFAGIPDGTYEFEKGQGFWVDVTGWHHPLPKDHPLYKRDINQIVKLYNFGIEMHEGAILHRYAYFRDGDLYTMGSPIFKKGEPLLEAFVKKEGEKALGFIDRGAPKSLELVKAFGYKVPERHYLMLGDNYAVSQDSRIFGAVAQENIEGRPSFILWPPGERWGFVFWRNPYPMIVAPRVVMWVIAGIGVWLFLKWERRKKRG